MRKYFLIIFLFFILINSWGFDVLTKYDDFTNTYDASTVEFKEVSIKVQRYYCKIIKGKCNYYVRIVFRNDSTNDIELRGLTRQMIPYEVIKDNFFILSKYIKGIHYSRYRAILKSQESINLDLEFKSNRRDFSLGYDNFHPQYKGNYIIKIYFLARVNNVMNTCYGFSDEFIIK